MAKEILVVDDEKDIRLLIKGILEDEGFSVREADGAKQAYDSLSAKVPSLVILDIWLQGSAQDGLEILTEIKKQNPNLPVLMISGHGTIETAVSAIKLGAYDFIEKPFKTDRLILMIERALEASTLKKENESLRAKVQTSDVYLGDSSASQTIRQTIEKIALSNSRVLITGQPGTGKNVAARAIHAASKRKDGPFYVLSCANLHPDHFEEELFGSERGGIKQGAMEMANGGILYLDEVGDMPIETQSRIVRALQEEKFKRVGGHNFVSVDIRIIASTNRNLTELINAGKFREDLFYRLNVVPLNILPLKDRPQDIPVLANHFIKICSEQSGLKMCTLSEQAIAMLQNFDWPGNARQLKNIIEWMMIMKAPDKDIITPENLPSYLSLRSDNTPSQPPANDYIGLPLKEAREQFEKNYLLSQISRFEGNISRTAQFVGMERSALHRKMKSLEISGNDKQDDDENNNTSRIDIKTA